uniref:RRM domain-containing protein n=2 Tax=Physcomitrium patens TaxID=3218 RepID=A0A2K1K3Y7_PHYPA|nr:hypothetical protein PHYPA_012968 [Physcomitrium patens]
MSSLKKFGDAVCQHASENFTVVSTEGIFLEKAKPASAIAEPEKVADLALLGNGLLNVCGTCRKKGDYWTLKCPSKESVSTKVFSFGGEKPTTGDDVSAGASVKGSYVPPSMRDREVTNISEDTREQDLQELFRPFGAISRICVAFDRESGISRGFTFIDFVNRY